MREKLNGKVRERGKVEGRGMEKRGRKGEEEDTSYLPLWKMAGKRVEIGG